MQAISDFEFEKRFPESAKPPDYSFLNNAQPVLLDVKDFRGEPKDFGGAFGFYEEPALRQAFGGE
ncbi:MAG: hypothetical protein HYU27_03405 [Acidobacteria bacterium]|nr:hypothetical protein [Acidobacteriota bacterium]